MKSKRIISLLLCVLMVSVMLVGCEEVIGQYYYDVYLPNGIGVTEEKPEVKLDFYVITEFPENYDNPEVKQQHNSDLVTVKDNINLYLQDKYKTTLDIHFLSADNYESTIKSATSGIVLINSESLMSDMRAGGKLVDLTNYLTSSEYQFGTLNVQIASTLLDAARESDGKLYCIPNNHIVDSYDYIAINSAIAAQLQFGKTDISEMKAVDSPKTLELIAVAQTHLGLEAADVVKVYNEVSYGFSNEENAPKSEWIYNVSRYPTVTKAEAYSTAYGVINGTAEADRAMEVIYALNTDIQFRNLLQYGVANINYDIVNNQSEDIDSDATYVNPKENTLYKMNILYTGDVFKAYYNLEYWTEDMADIGKVQNSESVLK